MKHILVVEIACRLVVGTSTISGQERIEISVTSLKRSGIQKWDGPFLSILTSCENFPSQVMVFLNSHFLPSQKRHQAARSWLSSIAEPLIWRLASKRWQSQGRQLPRKKRTYTVCCFGPIVPFFVYLFLGDGSKSWYQISHLTWGAKCVFAKLSTVNYCWWKKSCTTWNIKKPCKSWDQLPTSIG